MELHFDNQETVRVRIDEEIWTDQSPVGPRERADATGGAGSIGGAGGMGSGLGAKEGMKRHPYMLVGSMEDAGMGPCLWWDGDDENGEREGMDESGE